MSYDIQGKTAKAQSIYQAALASLEAARSTYDQGPKVEYTAALEQQQKLTAKITAYQAEATAAEEEFKQAFEAAGYERTVEVCQALGRKNDALAMAEELEAALTKVQIRLTGLLLDASPKAQELHRAHECAEEAYSLWKVYEAMGESADTLKQALAHVSRTIGDGRDELGRPDHSSSGANEQMLRSLAFIWDGLLQMASELGQPDLPFASADISPLKPADILSPAQRHQAQHRLDAAIG